MSAPAPLALTPVAPGPLLSRHRGVDHLELTLSHRAEAAEAARLAVLEFLAPFQLSARLIYQIEVILEETLMNIAWHAFKDDLDHQVRVSLHVRDGSLSLCFSDDGAPFDPTLAVDKALPASIDDATPGGLGLMLVRKFAQRIDYQREQGCNVLTITVARS